MSKVDLDRFTDFMVEYKKEISKEYEEEIERLNNTINVIVDKYNKFLLDNCLYNPIKKNELNIEIDKLLGVDKE